MLLSKRGAMRRIQASFLVAVYVINEPHGFVNLDIKDVIHNSIFFRLTGEKLRACFEIFTWDVSSPVLK